MRTNLDHLEEYRTQREGYESRPGDNFGVFFFRRGTATIIVISSPGDESMKWEHVSAHVREASGKLRVPTWAEMSWLKDQFWEAEECVVQYHPPRSEYVSNHDFVLHLWRPLGIELPRPPIIAV